MTDARGRHLPFDRAAVGVGMYWYSLPDGEATVVGEIVLHDGYNLLGAGPFAGYAYERHPVGRVRAINDTVDLLLQVILRGKSATFPAHKVMPPPRLFARGAERMTVARKTLSKGDESGLVLRCDGARCVVDHFESGFAKAADGVVYALAEDGWDELLARKPNGPWAKARLAELVSYPGLDGSRIDVAYGGGFVERVQWIDTAGVFLARARLEVEGPGHRGVLVVEHADGGVYTAGVGRAGGGGFSFSWGRFPERGTPDATPLPLTLADMKRGAHPPPH